MKTRRIAIKAFDHIVEMFFYVDFEQLIKQSLVSNRVESFTKIYETSIDFSFMVVVFDLKWNKLNNFPRQLDTHI